MTTHNFNNDATQSERKAIITSERNTFLARTEAELEEESGGRFKKKTRTTIVGVNPASAYPRLPPSSPWSCPDPTGVEPILGVDVNEVPDLGFSAAHSTNSGEAEMSSTTSPLAIEASPAFLKRRV